MINLFIDTNIFLNFYSFSDDDLDKLSNLHSLISKTNQIKLYVPSQLVDEFNRNRENRIKDAMKKFRDSNVKSEIPKLCSGFDEAKIIFALSKQIYEEKNKLTEKISQAIENKTLKADLLINDLFSAPIEIEDNIIVNAKKRFDLGNPPGKNKSYGDAVNWEFLLEKVPEKEDLYFVGDDIDYKSPLNENNFSSFLAEEWKKKKSSKIYYYKSVNNFFKDKFPQIQLKDDYIIDIKIEEFAESRSFDIARSRLNGLHQINEFSDAQVNAIIKASINNDQIYNAHAYSDFVGRFLKEIVEGHEQQIDPEILEEFNKKFYIEPKEE